MVQMYQSSLLDMTIMICIPFFLYVHLTYIIYITNNTKLQNIDLVRTQPSHYHIHPINISSHNLI
jgi:hypothetical protein